MQTRYAHREEPKQSLFVKIPLCVPLFLFGPANILSNICSFSSFCEWPSFPFVDKNVASRISKQQILQPHQVINHMAPTTVHPDGVRMEKRTLALDSSGGFQGMISINAESCLPPYIEKC